MPLLTTACHDIAEQSLGIIFNFWKMIENSRKKQMPAFTLLSCTHTRAPRHTSPSDSSQKCVVFQILCFMAPHCSSTHTEKELIEVCRNCCTKIGKYSRMNPNKLAEGEKSVWVTQLEISSRVGVLDRIWPCSPGQVLTISPLGGSEEEGEAQDL